MHYDACVVQRQTVIVAIGAACLGWFIVSQRTQKDLTEEQANAIATAFVRRHWPEMKSAGTRVQLPTSRFWYFEFKDSSTEFEVGVDAKGREVSNLVESKRQFGASIVVKEALVKTEAEARRFGSAFAEKVGAGRELGLETFKFRAASVDARGKPVPGVIMVSYRLLVHGVPFIDHPYGFVAKFDPADGLPIHYSGLWTAPDVVLADPKSALTLDEICLKAYGRKATTIPMLDSELGYAAPKSGGRAVLAWRLSRKDLDAPARLVQWRDARSGSVILETLLTAPVHAPRPRKGLVTVAGSSLRPLKGVINNHPPASSPP